MRAAALLLAALTVSAHAQWQILDSHSTADFRGVDSVGAGVVWVSGTNGTVMRSEDAGYLWQHCTTPPGAEKLDFRGIQAFDANTAIVMSSGPGDQSRLYKTTDGCQSWKLVFTNPDKEGFWDDLKFAGIHKDGRWGSSSGRGDPGHRFGVLLGDPVNGHFTISLTFDGGETWSHDPMPVNTSGPGEVVFAASNSSLFINSLGEREFCTGGTSGARVVQHTTGSSEDTVGPNVFHDARTGWSTVISIDSLDSTTRSQSRGCFSLAEHDRIQVAVGGDYSHPDETTFTAWTTALPPNRADSSIRAATTPPHGYRSAVAYDAPTKTWITVGPNGTDISTDDGRNWRALKPDPKAGDQPDADQQWNALSLPFVVGPHGRIGMLRPSALKPDAVNSAAR